MPATRLTNIRVEKPWGRHALWPGFADAPGAPVGEIWFETPAGMGNDLLVKYLFTSERLSIQVHPDDPAARAAGYPHGKDEAWVVLAAEPDATIGIGLTRTVSVDELRAAALDGSIETLLDWRPVRVGDVIYSPAGTVHAIGAGLTLIEVQQSLDLTYRLYDYGRPRDLHLDAGLAVSERGPFIGQTTARMLDAARSVLVEGGKFVLERVTPHAGQALTLPLDRPGLLIPVSGGGRIDGAAFSAGQCWLVEGRADIDCAAGSDVLFAYPGADVIPTLLV